MEEFVPVVVAATLIVKIVSTFKAATAREWVKVATQVAVWVAGVAVVALFQAAGINMAFLLGQDSLNGAGQVLAGVSFGSAGSVFLYDLFAAIDNTRSSAEPRLLGDGG